MAQTPKPKSGALKGALGKAGKLVSAASVVSEAPKIVKWISGCCCLAIFGICVILLLVPMAFLGTFMGENSASYLAYEGNLDPTEVGQCIDEFIKKRQPKSPLIGHGATFVAAGNANKVHPALLVAMAAAESSYATVWNAIPSSTMNYASLTCGCTQKEPCIRKPNSSNPRTWEAYSSYDDAITRHARYVNRRYISRGITDVAAIGKIYCGPGCTGWVSTVKKVYKQLIDECPGLEGGGSEMGPPLAGGDLYPPYGNYKTCPHTYSNHSTWFFNLCTRCAADYSMKTGSNIYAINNGRLSSIYRHTSSDGQYRGYTAYFSDGRYRACYAHWYPNAAIRGKSSADVKRGQQIGTVCGKSNGTCQLNHPHLHFELIKNGQMIPYSRQPLEWGGKAGGC